MEAQPNHGLDPEVDRLKVTESHGQDHAVVLLKVSQNPNPDPEVVARPSHAQDHEVAR